MNNILNNKKLSVNYFFREKRYGFVYFVEIDGVIMSKSVLSIVQPLMIRTQINFKDPNDKDYVVMSDMNNAFRHKHFFQVQLTEPMKYADIPDFLARVKPSWTTLQPG